MQKKKTVVITGASGFLGKNLVRALCNDERFQVYGLSSHPEEMQAELAAENVTFYPRTIIEEKEAGAFLPDSLLINCAYPRNSTGFAIADGMHYLQTLFLAAVQNKCEAVINISSQSVYPPQRTEPADEQMPLSLETPYAVGKYAVELMLESICGGTGACYTNLRMASLIGPGFDQRITNRFVKTALEKGVLQIKKNRQIFGFFDVQDAVAGIIRMLDTDPSAWEKVYNLGGAAAYTLTEIAETVQDVIQEMDHKEVIIHAVDSDGTGCSVMRDDLFNSTFLFSPEVDLRESIRRIYEWIKMQ